MSKLRDKIQIQDQDSEEVEIDLLELFQYFRSQILILIIALLVGGVAAGAITHFLITPKVLILDDSTSAVDTATDASIRRAFAEEIPGTTKLIIAQRISSIQNCDRIIVMEDGRVNDFGAHEELLARNQIYQEIYESQAAGNADFDEPGKE